jgi:ketosteroid isomerase-like protein
MTQPNVEVVQRAVEASNRRDYAAFLAEFDPDVEWHAVFQVMFGGSETVCGGHDEVEAYLRELDEDLSARTVEVSEFRDLGERGVVALGRVTAVGKASKAPIESPIGFVIEFRDGKIHRLSDYLSHDDALEAAGLAG